MPAKLDEILAHGSESFRRLNPGLAAPLPALPAAKPKANKKAVVARQVSHPEPEQGVGEPLAGDARPAGESARSPVPRPHVHIYLHRVRLLDTDNKWASCKPLLDAIRHAGLIPDDREDDIDLTVTQHRVPKYINEGTGIAITYY